MFGWIETLEITLSYRSTNNTDDEQVEPNDDLGEPVRKKKKTELKTFKNGHGCCVVECHNKTGTDKKLRFFHVVKSNKTQTDMWVQAIKRINPDGTKWVPTSSTRICEVHFKQGQPSSDPNHPDFVPTLFLKTKHKKAASEEDIARNQRVILLVLF